MIFSQAIKMTFEIDQWLSNILKTNVYRVTPDYRITNIQSFQTCIEKYLHQKNIFMFTKIPVNEILTANFFQQAGFKLVDTNIVLEKTISAVTDNTDNGFKIRFSVPEDQSEVEKIAENSFKYSRFHLDPGIPQKKANQIKVEWVNNYYANKRGNWMVVAVIDNRIVGFLQLLAGMNNTLIIDLIATDIKFRKKGIAKAMIAFAETSLKTFDKIRTGTQISNIPAIRLYENLAFKICQADYVFHFHNTNSV